MSEFDMKITGCTFNQRSKDYYSGYEYGEKSQQAKIDELNEVVNGWKDEYRIMTMRYEKSKKQIDELQASVDEAVDYIAESGGVNLTSEIALNDILKGNKDEN